MATAFQPEPPLTIEEFARRPDTGEREELVKGRVVRISPPGTRHGIICNRAGRLLGNFVEEHALGHVLNNDSGVITARGPDTVRGADLAYYSFERLPREKVTSGYPEVAPDLVIEVRSPSERWPLLLAKVVEYLEAGVAAVVVLDDATRSAQVYDALNPVRILSEHEELILPAVLPGFHVAVRRFFD